MGVVLWGAFIEKNGLSEDEVLQRLGYSTEKILPNNIGFETAVRCLLKSPNDSEIFTFSTSKEYLILIDRNYSIIATTLEGEKEKAKHFENYNLFKFKYDNNVNIEALSFISNGELKRVVHRSDYLGNYEYGERIELEPNTTISHTTVNSFKNSDEIIIENHNPFIVLSKTIENMFEKVTGKKYRPEYYHLQEIRLDKRIIKKKKWKHS